jgi:hypothetical protein
MRYRFLLGTAVSAALLAACSGSPAGGPPSLGASASRPALRAGITARPGAGQSLLYVADQFNQRVAIFAQGGGGNPPPIGQITDGIAGPDGLFVDRNGTLYVCNFGAGTVTEYPAGQTSPSKTLTGSIGPKYVTAGNDGTVYVSDFNSGSNGRVLEYAGGSTTPTTTIPISPYPAGVALDNRNRLYVAYGDAANNDLEVLRFAPGRTKGKNLGIHVAHGSPGGMTIDNHQDLVIADQAVAVVDIFPPGATQPSHEIGGFNLAYQVALTHKDTRLWVSDPFGPSVQEVSYPAGTPLQSRSNSLSGAFGVATSPEGAH